MDLQSVLLCPKTKASKMYYKLNYFTCFNLGNKDGYCYAWEEHEGSLSSEVLPICSASTLNCTLHPSPYKVTQLYHSDFMKLSGAYVTKIRPGRKVGDPTVHDLRALQYLADGRIRHKLDFESDWEDLPQRLSIPEEPVPLGPTLSCPITLRKYNDLQAMKPVLPRVAHQYYDNLPHQ
ncbi:hypothetical protein JOQ06_013916 [Pogonophryne albipinna]|uniref:Uncharacterized protein n=1 Tax=Pogonophryne albipinna TaxID=1090488 RepID=A0AAD6A6W6_9TELE|nr:hypothetical protein JOQ06_013916 [Pogonophryne albipinna]